MSLLFTTTPETSTSGQPGARLVKKDKDCTKPGFTLIRAWPKIDPTAADTLSTTLDAVATYPDPKADEQPYSGTFVNSKVEVETGTPEQGDRSCTIIQTLILVTSPADTAALAALAGIITQGNLLKDLFGKPVAGSDSTIGEEDTISYRWHNINTGSRATLMAISDANLVSGLPGAGWSYVQREFKEEDNNTATFTVVFQKMTWNTAFAAGSPDLTWSDNYGTPHQRNNHLWLKVGNAVDYSAVYTPTAGYNVMRVEVTERRDGAINIQRVEWKEAIGVLNTEIEERRKDLIRPWGIKSGTRYRVTIVNHNLTPKTDAYTTLSTASGTWMQAGYKVVEELREEFNKETGLWDVYVTYENVVWDDWGSAADLTEWFDCGSDANGTEGANTGSEKTGYRQTWLGVKKGDLATAIAALRDGTGQGAPLSAAWIVVEASVSDNQDGSISLRQTQLRQVNNVDVDDVVHTNPHGFQDGTLTFLRTHYERFNKTELDAISETPPGGAYVLHRVEEDIDGNGLWSKIYTYMAPTWGNTTPTYILQGKKNPTGFDIGTTKVATGIPNASAVSLFASESATAGYAIDDLVMTERANGEVEFRKAETFAKTYTDQVVVEFRPGYGGQEDTQRVWWPAMAAANATLVYNEAIANAADMNPGTPMTYQPNAPDFHKLLSIRRVPVGNGLVGIERLTSKTISVANYDDWNAYEISHSWKVAKWRRIWDTATKTFKDQVRFFTYTDLIIQDSSINSHGRAYAWANGTCGTFGTVNPIKGQVKFFGRGRYWALCRTASCTAWGDDSGVYADLGA